MREVADVGGPASDPPGLLLAIARANSRVSPGLSRCNLVARLSTFDSGAETDDLWS